jgi:ELMO/CED-12 family/ELMO, armadillo-like helical domain
MFQASRRRWITYKQAEAPIEFDLTREHSLQVHIDTICSEFRVAKSEWPKYTLFVENARLYVSEQHLASTTSALFSSEGQLYLRLKPEHEAARVLASLKKSTLAVKKRTIFEAKTKLSLEPFAIEFLKQNGIGDVLKLIGDTGLSTQAYGLQALEIAMSYNVGWTPIADVHVRMLVALISSANLNSAKSAVRVVQMLVDNPKYSDAAVQALTSKAADTKAKPFADLIALLRGQEVVLQTRALALVNSLIASAPMEDGIRRRFIGTLQKLGLNLALQRQHRVIDHADFHRQLVAYQRLCFGTMAPEPYDSANKAHEAALAELWALTFPGVELDGRTSEQWKWMGFQGTNPNTDWRGMGFVGLQHLLYFAKSHGDEYRKMVNEQRSRTSNSYPFAVAGINLSQMLYDLLGIFKCARNRQSSALAAAALPPPPPLSLSSSASSLSLSSSSSAAAPSSAAQAAADEDIEGELVPILFDHTEALEELYCITFQVLDHTWDDMQASYMDFPKVIASVRKKVADALAQSRTLANFDKLAATWKRRTMLIQHSDLLPVGSTTAESSASPNELAAVAATSSSDGDAAASSSSDSRGLSMSAGGEPPSLAAMRAKVASDITALVERQCADYSVTATEAGGGNGAATLAYYGAASNAKAKPKRLNAARLKLSADRTQLSIVLAGDGANGASSSAASNAADSLSSTVAATFAVDNISAVLTGSNVPPRDEKLKRSAALKGATLDASRAFAIRLKGADSVAHIFGAQNAPDFVNCVDGVNALCALPLQCPQTIADINDLCRAEIFVRMLNLDGLSLPSTLDLPIPPLPK